MRLKEYQAKEIFKKYNISVPNGFLIRSIKDIKSVTKDVVLKAQVLVGGRGKAGGVKFANKNNVKELAQSMFSSKIKGCDVKEILVEEKLEKEKEYYLGITIDEEEKKPVVIFSKEGGIDIEEEANKNQDKVFKVYIDDNFSAEKIAEHIHFSEEVIESLYRIFQDYDAELVEINPLVRHKGKLVAEDAKIIIDENSLFRHKDIPSDKILTKLEAEAEKQGLHYVELSGNIGVIGNGAGLVLATLDLLEYFGGKVANFLDIGGGAKTEKMEKALEIVMKKNVDGIFINIFGGITRCDEIAQGLVNYKEKNHIGIPFVVRMIGTNEDKAKEILDSHGITYIDSIEHGAEKIVKLVEYVNNN